MRRIALVSLTMLSGCGYHTWWNPPFSTGYNPNAPMSTSVMRMTKKPWRNEEITTRFMNDAERGVEPFGVGSALIDFA